MLGNPVVGRVFGMPLVPKARPAAVAEEAFAPVTPTLAAHLDTASIAVTPDGVVLNMPVARIGTRGIAYLLDLLVISVVGGVISQIMAIFAAVGLLSPSIIEAIGAYVAVGVPLVLLVGYPVLMEQLFRGQTLGKMVVGARVVDVSGGPVRAWQSVVRSVFGLVELTVLVFIGVFTSLLNPLARRVGDLSAGTLVISDRGTRKPIIPLVFPIPPGSHWFVDAIDPTAITEEQYSAIRAVLLRINTLDAASCDQLMATMSTQVAERIALPRPYNVPPATFLVCVCCAYQRLEGGLRAVGLGQFEGITPMAWPNDPRFTIQPA